MGKRRATRVLGFGDVHWSDREPAALAVLERAAAHFKPDVIVDGGDLLNCDAFAHHPMHVLADDDGYDYAERELYPAYAWSKKMEGFAADRMIQLAGNHDEWLERWMANGTRAHKAFQSLRPSVYMRKNRGPRHMYIPYSKQFGDRKSRVNLSPELIVVHGWVANKYAAERHRQLAKPYSVIFHHTHRAETAGPAPMFDGRHTQAMNAGCLCRLQPKYNHGSPTEWVHGFWVAYLGHRSFTLYPIVIRPDFSCVLPDGKELR